MSLLITPTLLNSIEFAKNAPPSWKLKAMEDLTAKLRRESGTFPAWVRRGSEFEDAVYMRVNGGSIQPEEGGIDINDPVFLRVCKACAGGTFQDVFKRKETIHGEEVLFYCKTDVVTADRIIDIKTTLNYKGPHKYLGGFQHPMYCWTSGISNFTYLVVQWENEDSWKIKDLFEANYCVVDMEAVRDRIVSATKDALEFIEKKGLYDDFYYTFSRNK